MLAAVVERCVCLHAGCRPWTHQIHLQKLKFEHGLAMEPWAPVRSWSCMEQQHLSLRIQVTAAICSYLRTAFAGNLTRHATFCRMP